MVKAGIRVGPESELFPGELRAAEPRTARRGAAVSEDRGVCWVARVRVLSLSTLSVPALGEASARLRQSWSVTSMPEAPTCPTN